MAAYEWGFTLTEWKADFAQDEQLQQMNSVQFELYKNLSLGIFNADQYFFNKPNEFKDDLYKLIMAHLFSVSLRGGGVVGPISNAAEGSVNIGAASLQNPNFWQDTNYGRIFWQSVKPYLPAPAWVSGSGLWV